MLTKNEKAIINRLNELFAEDNETIKKLPLDAKDKYAVFSDLHLGDGRDSDNFVHNEETMQTALQYYKDKKYSVILLGDVEEFWQFSFKKVCEYYGSGIYSVLRSFPAGTVHRVAGNHDIEWAGLRDPIAPSGDMQFGYPVAVRLGNFIFMVHGHQGDVLSEKKAWASRFWVHLFKYVEPLARKFGYENYAASKSQVPKNRERVYYQWAKEKKVILICGHTHRAIFASRIYYEWLKKQIKKENTEYMQTQDAVKRKELLKEIRKHKRELLSEIKRGRDINPLETNGDALPCYFNSGSCLYKSGITNLEIEHNKIRLIKWHRDVSKPLNERREELWDGEILSEIRSRL